MDQPPLQIITDTLQFKHDVFPADSPDPPVEPRAVHFGRYKSEELPGTLRRLTRLRERLEEALGEKPSPPDRIELEMLLSWSERTRIYFEEIRIFETHPQFYIHCVFDGLEALQQRADLPLETRSELLATGLRRVGPFLQEATRNLRRPPRLLVELAMETIEASVPFLKGLVRSSGAVGGIDRLCHGAYHALVDFHDFLQKVILPRSRDRFAVGPEIYGRLTRNWLRIEPEPAEIRRWGQKILEDARHRMEQIARRIDPDRDWREILTEIQQDIIPDAELIDSYRREAERAREFLEDRRLVRLPPPERLQIQPTPIHMRGLVPVAGYAHTGYDASQGGTLFLTPREEEDPLDPPAAGGPLPGHSRSGLPLIVAGNAYPGSHVRALHPTRQDSPVRRELRSAMMGNGWSMYAELLMGEQGYYDCPRRELQQVRHEMWRAIRLLVDVGIHADGMSVEQAVGLLTEGSVLPYSGAFREVRRYAVTPGLQLTYLMGREQILELRREAQRRWKADFTLERFHQRLLGSGPVPPILVGEEVLA